MSKRVAGLIAYLLLACIFAVALAATTFAPSYRACAASKNAADAVAQLVVFVECEAELLRSNEASLVAMAIVFIAFVTLALQRSTARLWKLGERQIGIAEKTVETARLSAQAAVLAERAHLFVSVKASNLERPLENARRDEAPAEAAATPVDSPRVDYVLSNYGRTVALMKEVKHAMTWDPSTDCAATRPDRRGHWK